MWPGLLGWSTKYHDGTDASKIGPMTEERKEWLKKALETGFGGKMEDPNERLKRAFAKLVASSDEVDKALSEIDECADFPDCCDNFDKLGGLEAFQHLLDCRTEPEVVSSALSVLSLYLGNNPAIQQAAAARGFIERFVKMSSSSNDEVVEYRSLSCLGQLLRGVGSLEIKFLESEGAKFLLYKARSLSMKTRSKALSLIRHMLTVKKQYIGGISILASDHPKNLLKGGVDELTENVAMLMSEIYSSPKTPESADFWEASAGVLNRLPKKMIDCKARRLAIINNDDYLNEASLLDTYISETL